MKITFRSWLINQLQASSFTFEKEMAKFLCIGTNVVCQTGCDSNLHIIRLQDEVEMIGVGHESSGNKAAMTALSWSISPRGSTLRSGLEQDPLKG